VDGIEAEAVSEALNGWAITRIPPGMSTCWQGRHGPMALVAVSDVVLHEDLVRCGRNPVTNDWTSALKL